ncbi:MAG: SPOR domain-containing protein [Bacteroidota bacterium]
MKHKHGFLLITAIIFALLLWGCKSSEESQNDQNTAPPPSKVEKKAEQPPPPAPAEQKDTVKSEPPAPQVQPEQKPAETVQPETQISHELPKGNFSVQIGAFAMPDKADQWASLARTRFGKSVFTLKDEKTNNTKVLVGEFSVKDEARTFRDQIVQQYPDDYKDAWVYEVPHQ